MTPLKGKRNLVFLASVLVSFVATTSGTFLDSCGSVGDKKFSFFDDGTLSTYCYDPICDSVQYALLNLNDCFGNNQGMLEIPGNSIEVPNFMDTCENCSITNSTWLKCDCQSSMSNGGMGYKETMIDLDSSLSNWNGYLKCRNVISAFGKFTYKCMPYGWQPALGHTRKDRKHVPVPYTRRSNTTVNAAFRLHTACELTAPAWDARMTEAEASTRQRRRAESNIRCSKAENAFEVLRYKDGNLTISA